jgi:hypothetical protein
VKERKDKIRRAQKRKMRGGERQKDKRRRLKLRDGKKVQK